MLARLLLVCCAASVAALPAGVRRDRAHKHLAAPAFERMDWLKEATGLGETSQAKLARERAERRERALAANAKLKEESEAWARREHDRAVANHKFSKEDLAMLALAKKQQALKIFTPAMFKGFFLNEDALFLKYFGKHCESLWDWVDAKHTAVDELKAWMQTPLPLIEEIAKKKMRKRDKLKDINPFSSKDRVEEKMNEMTEAKKKKVDEAKEKLAWELDDVFTAEMVGEAYDDGSLEAFQNELCEDADGDDRVLYGCKD